MCALSTSVRMQQVQLERTRSIAAAIAAINLDILRVAMYRKTRYCTFVFCKFERINVVNSIGVLLSIKYISSLYQCISIFISQYKRIYFYAIIILYNIYLHNRCSGLKHAVQYYYIRKDEYNKKIL